MALKHLQEMLNVANLTRGDTLWAFRVNKYLSKQGFEPRSSGLGSLTRVTEAGVKEELEVQLSFSPDFFATSLICSLISAYM